MVATYVSIKAKRHSLTANYNRSTEQVTVTAFAPHQCPLTREEWMQSSNHRYLRVYCTGTVQSSLLLSSTTNTKYKINSSIPYPNLQSPRRKMKQQGFLLCFTPANPRNPCGCNKSRTFAPQPLIFLELRHFFFLTPIFQTYLHPNVETEKT